VQQESLSRVEGDQMHPRNKFLFTMATIGAILGLVLYKKYFGLDWLSFIYLVLIVIIVYGIIDFFFG
jgi:hypothetical protein